MMTVQTTQGKPQAVKNILADKVTSMTAAPAIVAALYDARNGRGQHIKLAMIDAAAYYLMGDMMVRHTFLSDKRVISAVASSAEPFRTADGYMTIAPLTDKHWTVLLGRFDWKAETTTKFARLIRRR
jgi:crotonobetainyl-CoA:carnitine CoA-transferase CaiB-like acyl-CoA transferase